ncbi:MAG TPA: glycosyltransferase, partial [Vicinamibacterales bacterium]|nr:glycosyltransferase [Vicinamibacterales bacterium]
MPNPTPARRLRIFFLIGSLEIGGSETQLVELASRIDPARFDVTVCSMTDKVPLGAVLRDRGIRLMTLGMTGIRSTPSLRLRAVGVFNALRGLARLWWVLLRERPDVVHGFLITAYVTAAFVGRAAGVRRIVASRRSLGLFKENRRAALLLERWADRLTDLFVANSDAVRVDTLAREPIDPADIIVIRNGVDFPAFESAAAHDSAGPPRVVIVANLIQYKGHEYFLRAWKDVLGEFAGAAALLVGEGPERPVLEGLAQQLGVADSVQLLGSRRDVAALLSTADVYVQPSLQEGYSNAILEAMAAGLPVIATAVGGNTEAVTDGATGLLVPPADVAALASAMRQLLANPVAARVMGARAR